MRALERSELVFGIGPAGTGKTYLAVAHAAMLLERGVVERIILSRPAVEAGERLGFLPGDMKEKVDPYLRPLYDALYDMMPAEKVERAHRRRRDRDRAARLHARPHAGQCRRHPRRGAEHHADADEDVPDPPRRGLAHDRHRRSDADRPAAAAPSPGLVEALRILDGVDGRRSPCASTTPTSCAIRWSPRSSGPTTATPRCRAGSAPARTDARPRPGAAGAEAPRASQIDMTRSRPATGRPKLTLRALVRKARRRGAGRDRRGAGEPAANSASSSPTTRISARSTPAGAARTSRPTCCPSRLSRCSRASTLPPMLGDIVLAAETVAREAELEGKPLDAPYHPSRGPRLPASARPRPRDRGGGRGDGSAGAARRWRGLPFPIPTRNRNGKPTGRR